MHLIRVDDGVLNLDRLASARWDEGKLRLLFAAGDDGNGVSLLWILGPPDAEEVWRYLNRNCLFTPEVA